MTNTDDTTDTRDHTDTDDERSGNENPTNPDSTTDENPTNPDSTTDENPSTDRKRSRSRRQRMADVDHTSPVEGPNRVFERGGSEYADADQPPANSDGDRSGQSHATAGDPDGPAGANRDQKHSRMEDVDHTAPVAGVTRTFARGGEADDTDE